VYIICEQKKGGRKFFLFSHIFEFKKSLLCGETKNNNIVMGEWKSEWEKEVSAVWPSFVNRKKRTKSVQKKRELKTCRKYYFRIEKNLFLLQFFLSSPRFASIMFSLILILSCFFWQCIFAKTVMWCMRSRRVWEREFSSTNNFSFARLKKFKNYFFHQSSSGRQKKSSRVAARYLLSLMALAGIISEL
jgi:hypothetical protein